jgi:hypothetical protein
VEQAEEAATAPQVSKPAAQTRFVLEKMEELREMMKQRFDVMDSKFEAVEKLQTQLAEMDLKMGKHAQALEQMQVKVNLSMETLGKV